jgi:hypothetical protein
LVSASEKFGADMLLDEPLTEDEPPAELLPDVDGVDEDDDGLLEDDEDCATANVDSAKSTAAVMMLRVLGMD